MLHVSLYTTTLILNISDVYIHHGLNVSDNYSCAGISIYFIFNSHKKASEVDFMPILQMRKLS